MGSTAKKDAGYPLLRLSLMVDDYEDLVRQNKRIVNKSERSEDGLDIKKSAKEADR